MTIRLKPSRFAEIEKVVCREFGVKADAFTSSRRLQEYVKARQFLWYIISEVTGLGPTAIGRMYNKDRTTICHSIEMLKKAKLHREAMAMWKEHEQRNFKG